MVHAENGDVIAEVSSHWLIGRFITTCTLKPNICNDRVRSTENSESMLLPFPYTVLLMQVEWIQQAIEHGADFILQG